MNTESDACQGIAPQQEWSRWIAEISQGNEDALCALYEAALGRVYAVALRITRRHDLAEEVVQETFLQVWKSAASFDSQRGSPLTWLLMISRSRALSRLRRGGHDGACPNGDEGNCDEQQGQEANWIDNDPQSLMMVFESNSALHRAILCLESREQEMLALAFFNGLTYQEVAQKMDIPLGTVKTCIRRALQALHKKLDIFESGS